MDALDKGKFACGVFIDLQKAFNTVDHDILLNKLYHYGIQGIPLSLFRSYLSNRNQFVSIANCSSSFKVVRHGVPQGSVLRPLLFLLYINDLHNAIKFSLVHHFADDTNILHINDSPKQLSKQVNIDLKLLSHWHTLINRIKVLQNHAIRLMSFAPPRTSPSTLFANLNILKFSDIVLLQNIALLHNLFHKMPNSVQNIFAVDFTHNGTRGGKLGLINHPLVRTTNFGLHSIRYYSVKSWNDLQDSLPFNLSDLRSFNLKSELKDQIFKTY